MTMLIKCKTPYAVLLVGAEQGEGPLKFFFGDPVSPGIVFKVDPATALNEQFIQQISRAVGHEVSGLHIDIEQAFQNPVLTSDGGEATLFLAKWTVNGEADLEHWITMPDLLRKMPKDRNRLGYVKAWQVFTGALKESTKAVDILDILDPKLH